MRKILIILTVMLVGAYELQAQEYVMTVELNNGTKLSLNTNDVKEITFLEGKIVVSGSSLTDRIDSLVKVVSDNYNDLYYFIKDKDVYYYDEVDNLRKRIVALENRIDSVINANDETPSNPLVGTWYTICDDGTKETEVTYNADYTCTWREYESDGITVGDTDYGKYKVDGNKLSIWWGDSVGDPWTTNFTISGKIMTTTEGGGTEWIKK